MPALLTDRRLAGARSAHADPAAFESGLEARARYGDDDGEKVKNVEENESERPSKRARVEDVLEEAGEFVSWGCRR